MSLSITRTLAAALLGCLVAVPALAMAQPASASGDYIVTFSSLPDDVRGGRYGGHTVVGTNEALRFAVIRSNDAPGLTAHAHRDPNVISLEEDIEVHTFLTPNDPYYATYQYDLKGATTGIDAAWDRSTGSAAVKVAIADTGVRTTAKDLVGMTIAAQRDFVSNDNVAQDGNGHGSHVASTVAARLNNGLGLAGIAPATSMLFARVLNNQGSGTCSQVANGITWAADQGAHILSMSLGGGACSAEGSAVTYAQAKGTLIVAAAGNSGPCTDCISYPAKYDGVVAVTCTDANNALCSFSSRGPEAFISAPGKSTVGHYPAKSAGCGKDLDGCYALLSGTSMSTPHVAGVAALLKATHPTYDATALKAAIQASALDLGAAGRDSDFGYGLLQGSAV